MEETKQEKKSILGKSASVVKTIWTTIAVVLGSLLLVLIIALIISMFTSQKSHNGQTFTSKTITEGGIDQIAVVHLSGVIAESSDQSGLGFNSSVVSSKKTVELLDFLKDEDTVKAVILDINSPGGSAVASDDIYRSVRSLQENKPVIARMGDVAASGGYYVAAGADEIIANRGTLTGSIGVIIQMPKFKELYEKIGVDIRTFKSGEYKDIGSADRDMTEEEEVIIQSIITDTYDQFLDVVIEGRNMEEEKARALADGRIYSGKQAQENGLVDTLGNMQTARERATILANIQDPTIVEYQNASFLESLLSSVVPQLAPSLSLAPVIPQEKMGVYYIMEY